MKKLFLGIILTLALSACDQAKKVEDPSQITEVIVGGQKLCIPKAYIKSWDDPDNDTVPIQTMYPDFLPLEKSSQQHWEDGTWWKQVSLLLSGIRTDLSYDELLKLKMKVLKATKLVGSEHDGLLHYTQPEGEVQDKYDIWAERNNANTIVSYITCGEKLTQTSKPQCNFRHNHNSFFISKTFDKELLPHWKEIKASTISLIDSFNCNSFEKGEIQ